MDNLLLTARLDVTELLRARWFLLYSAVFGGIVALLMIFGLTESRVMGFTGLSRLLVTYIQLSMAILPIFILISTVRSVASDREAGVFEYMLSLPVSLGAVVLGAVLRTFCRGVRAGFHGHGARDSLGRSQRPADPLAAFLSSIPRCCSRYRSVSSGWAS